MEKNNHHEGERVGWLQLHGDGGSVKEGNDGEERERVPLGNQEGAYPLPLFTHAISDTHTPYLFSLCSSTLTHHTSHSLQQHTHTQSSPSQTLSILLPATAASLLSKPPFFDLSSAPPPPSPLLHSPQHLHREPSSPLATIVAVHRRNKGTARPKSVAVKGRTTYLLAFSLRFLSLFQRAMVQNSYPMCDGWSWEEIGVDRSGFGREDARNRPWSHVCVEHVLCVCSMIIVVMHV